MKLKYIIASWLFVAVIFTAIGYRWGHGGRPAPVKQVVTKYLPRNMLKLPKFNYKPLQPLRKYVFVPGKTDTVFRRDTVYVPQSYPRAYWLTKPNPIAQKGNTLQFRYYNPTDRRTHINEYAVQPKGIRWSVYGDVAMPLNNFFEPVADWQPVFGIRGRVAWRRLELSVGPYIDPAHDRITVLGGVSYRILGN